MATNIAATRSGGVVLTAAVARDLMTRIRGLLSQRAQLSLDLRKTRLDPAGARVLLSNLELVARAKGLQIDAKALAAEERFGLANLGYLVRLHNLAIKTDELGPVGLTARIACAQHIFSAKSQGSAVTLRDLASYRAYTAFDFGAREFDTLFEMFDGSEVRQALEKLARTDASVAQAIERDMGWTGARQPPWGLVNGEPGLEADVDRDEPRMRT